MSKLGHFGSLVIGEEQAAVEAETIKIGAHHFGPLVVGKVHAHGSLVTDEDTETQIRKAQGRFDPAKIYEATVPTARKLIGETHLVAELQAWKAAELVNPDHEGGRKGVLGALDDRLAELAGPAVIQALEEDEEEGGEEEGPLDDALAALEDDGEDEEA